MILSILQIILSFALITVIVLQAKGTGLGRAFGSTSYHSKRGVEKSLFATTIILSIAFLTTTVISAF
ncbi:MAG: hypothetical protein UX38_C0008G0009 [Microgenomates group bacterium GW2011_GWC1_46_16]|uniref:Protein-export membrane protein SecG n=2 Tax=Candidatus Collieribacteriota TaxID=1752725 RepID=A0A1F5FZ39_9BACT|nr:MAG: hypothetical protein UX32_C0007G0049 [Microgenomates group bacterium GW2011_GWF1_46_12]KKU26176.1 MAG: hypothetical protein UX38_C0008G0009 [Microgenomates group bacterium GW2011_GWC1_46_16]KKU28174.1 MAG: hypothetical protein UX40_C0002G0014 [Microgenomates group bacterium GW2011_GWF2_46_18]KKU43741.1 MAG: hypothetical protein UX59_C0010G0008 [Microgenomates group bacterium GW2011_GWA1_46_7]KKU45609.1 MAG: hypothetical protein UX63_C0003G0035 [Microgenomates group bacterium GW2011_GWB1